MLFAEQMRSWGLWGKKTHSAVNASFFFYSAIVRLSWLIVAHVYCKNISHEPTWTSSNRSRQGSHKHTYNWATDGCYQIHYLAVLRLVRIKPWKNLGLKELCQLYLKKASRWGAPISNILISQSGYESPIKHQSNCNPQHLVNSQLGSESTEKAISRSSSVPNVLH